MKRTLLAGAALCLGLHLGTARAAFIDGYLARCTTVGTGTCTEMSGSGYARQPISFSTPGSNGQSVNSIPFTFGTGGSGTVAGHAIYDAPTGGNLLAVLPTATPFSAGTSSAAATKDVASLQMTLTSLAVGNPSAVAEFLPGAAAIGSEPDGSVVSSGVPLVFNRGSLGAAPIAFTYLTLPTPGTYPSVEVMCTDCLKPGESAGAGTGMRVFQDGHSHWVSTAGTVAGH